MSVLGGDEELATKVGDEKSFNAENYEAWKESVTKDNMALVNFSSNSLVPLYELVDREAEGGEDRYKALKKYMTDGSVAADFSTYECGTVTEFDVPSFEDAKYNETLIKDIYLGGQWVGQVCNEYIPNINRDKRVTVVYPVVNNKPRYNMGFFLGDNKGHKPARVSWYGTNVAVEAYEELDYGAATTVYLRGASVLPKLPEGTTALKAEKPRDGVLDMTDYKYPLVKIFNNVWIREPYHSLNVGYKTEIKCIVDGKTFVVPFTQYIYNEFLTTALPVIPAGWRVPTVDDCRDMIDKLANNGFSQPVTAIVYGGVTGFEELLCYSEGNVSGEIRYNLFDGELQIRLKDGILGAGPGYLVGPIRLVKE